MNADCRKRRTCFAVVLLLQTLLFGYLMLTSRLPRGHDTQSVFLLQHLFLSQASAGGGALWIPALAHGLVSTWFANLQAGLLQNVLLLAGGVPSGTPMLPIFYAGLFLEDLILLIGVWRLGGRFYRTPAAQFFVAVAAVGSSMWISNLYWNHRLVYGVPLTIALLLEALDTGSRPKLFLGFTLMALQLTGNAPYIPVLTMLTIGLFFGLHLLIFRKQLRPALALLRPRPTDIAWLGAVALIFASAAIPIVHGLGSIAQYHVGRNPDGSVTLDAFLTYAGSANPLRYLDLLLGITPSKDYSLYCGLCTVLFAGAAYLHRPGRRLLQLSLVLLILLFFSMGYLTLAGMAGYTAFYPLHFFRYISLASPLVRLFLILIAGFGFDAFARPSLRTGSPARRAALAAAALGLAALQMAGVQARSGDPSEPAGAFLQRIRDGLAVRPGAGAALPGALFGTAAIVAVGAVALFLKRRSVNPALLVPLVLVLHGSDVFRWRLQLLRDETVPLEEPLYAVQRVTPLPYFPRRSPSDEGGEPARAFARQVFDAGTASGTVYDYCDPFLRRDASWSRYFVTQWSVPVDLLLRAHAGLPLSGDTGVPPSFVRQETAGPRTRPDAYAKIIGESRDKLQVFTAAHAAGGDATVASMLAHPQFQGDVLLLTRDGDPDRPFDESLASRNERMPAPTKVLEFSADRVRIEVEVPPSQKEAWLAYADAWHADWRATVDGSPTPVERANLAYKAVRLHAGRNLVEFRFRAPLRSACSAVVGVLSLFWCGVLAVWTLKLLGAGRTRRPDEAGSHRSSGPGRPAAE